jgi:prepilin-type N-terminal cleavage/methylation domain-containing protein
MRMPASRQRVLAAQHRRSVPGGFSIVELLVVAAIIAVLAALAAPRYGNSIARYRADGAARRIEADLALARRHAMTTSATQELRFITGSNPSYVLTGMTHPDDPASTYVMFLAEDLWGAELISVDFGGDAKVYFDMYGLPDSDGTVVISVAGNARTITLDAETGVAAFN